MIIFQSIKDLVEKANLLHSEDAYSAAIKLESGDWHLSIKHLYKDKTQFHPTTTVYEVVITDTNHESIYEEAKVKFFDRAQQLAKIRLEECAKLYEKLKLAHEQVVLATNRIESLK